MTASEATPSTAHADAWRGFQPGLWQRDIMPNGGLRMVLSSLKAYGYTPDAAVVEAFTKCRKTHNDGVFDAYTADIRRCRSSHILTGLPDAYGRERRLSHHLP